MKVMDGDYVTAVTQSTFAAFIGMLASILVLCIFEETSSVYIGVYSLQRKQNKYCNEGIVVRYR